MKRNNRLRILLAGCVFWSFTMNAPAQDNPQWLAGATGAIFSNASMHAIVSGGEPIAGPVSSASLRAVQGFYAGGSPGAAGPDFLQDAASVDLQARPNPFRESLTLTLPEHLASIRITMIDMSGKLVLDKQVQPKSNTWVLEDLELLDPGLYLVSVRSGVDRWVVRVSKRE